MHKEIVIMYEVLPGTLASFLSSPGCLPSVCRPLSNAALKLSKAPGGVAGAFDSREPFGGSQSHGPDSSPPCWRRETAMQGLQMETYLGVLQYI